jgi:hypothetical protein
MKLTRVLIFIVLLLLSGCEDTPTVESDNSIGEYKDYYTHTFAKVVNEGTYRRSTATVFRKFNRDFGDIIEVYPGDTYEPELPKALKAGYYAEVLLEEVNRHAEKPKVIFSTKTKNLEEAKVKMPNAPGKFYRYTISVKDETNQLKDIKYEPLYTTYENYNMAIRMAKPSYKENELITFTVTNWGPNYLSVSKNFTVQKKTGDSWETIEPFPSDNSYEKSLILRIPSPWNMSYLEIDNDSILLPDKANETMILRYYSLDEGEYKIIVKAGSSRHVYQLEDTFSVHK